MERKQTPSQSRRYAKWILTRQARRYRLGIIIIWSASHKSLAPYVTDDYGNLVQVWYQTLWATQYENCLDPLM